MAIIRKIEEKGKLALWEHRAELCNDIWYTIHEEDVCNSLEEICYAFNDGDEIALVREVISRGNIVDFTDDATYEEYLKQFELYAKNVDVENPIYPYCCFETYEKAKEIFDLLKEV